ncbi:MAG: J domain-containing protein [Candidatus Brachytrichaceae bacterium NZ_4S206]|jgi:hypothetical protein
MTDPFAVLGLPPTSDVHAVRTAFRRLALRHHPDRNPGDPGASERFKRILWAYRAALRGPRTETAERPAPPAGPRPDRYGCASCGDTFPFPERCPRCGVDLHDRQAGTVDEARDPRVDAWVSRMEAKPVREDVAEALPMPGLLAAAFLLGGGLIWSLGGPLGPAMLFAAFAIYVALSEVHRLVDPAWLRRE